MKARYAATILVAGLIFFAGYAALFIAPDERTMHLIQRIFYFHVPSWMAMFTALSVAFIANIAYLATHKPTWDSWGVSAVEVGVVCCTIGLATGPLWARPVWGIWWTWDARLTTTLVLWLIYVSYLLLRRFAAGPQVQTLAAVLGIFGALDVPIVYMSNRWWRTQHPAPVFGGSEGSGMAPSMANVLLWNMLSWTLWGLLVLGLRYRVERKHQLNAQQEALEALEAKI